MLFSLKRYMENLKHEEQYKPKGQRRKVPTVTEMADAIDKSRVHVYNIMNNDVGSIKRVDLGTIIKLFRSRGFPADVGDLLEYRD